jgi:hypothetical protein
VPRSPKLGPRNERQIGAMVYVHNGYIGIGEPPRDTPPDW